MKRVDIEEDKDGQPLRTQHEHIDSDEPDSGEYSKSDSNEERHEHITKQEDEPHKHHYGKKIIIGLLVVIVILLGLTWYDSRPTPSSQPQAPQTSQTAPVNHDTQNEEQQNRMNNLQNKLDQLKMSSQQQANLLNRVREQKPAVQTKIYKYVQTVYKYVPSQSLKRKVANMVINHNLRH